MDEVEIKQLFKSYLSKPEDEFDAEIPISEFTAENIQMFLKSNMLSTLKLFGLECHQITPDFDGIEHFLRYRCNHWGDDLEHDDPFVSDSEVE